MKILKISCNSVAIKTNRPASADWLQGALAGGVSNLSFGDLLGDLGTTMYQYKFRIPPYYTLLVRSLTVLEGIALAADPQYKVRYSGGS